MTTVNGHTTQITGIIAAGAAANSPFTMTITGSRRPSRSVWHLFRQPDVYLGRLDLVGGFSLAPIADQANTEGDTVSLQINATSPSGIPLTFSATNLPNGLTLTTINNYTAQITGTIAFGAPANAPFATMITASNGTNSASQTFNWDVDENGPQLTDQGDLTEPVGIPETLDESETDPSGIASVQWQIS